MDPVKAQMVAELEIEMMTDLYNRWVRCSKVRPKF